MKSDADLVQVVGQHCARCPASRAACTAGNSRAIKMPMIVITTNNSTRVNPPSLREFGMHGQSPFLCCSARARAQRRGHSPRHVYRILPVPESRIGHGQNVFGGDSQTMAWMCEKISPPPGANIRMRSLTCSLTWSADPLGSTVCVSRRRPRRRFSRRSVFSVLPGPFAPRSSGSDSGIDARFDEMLHQVEVRSAAMIDRLRITVAGGHSRS